jgi:uncharacterized membrane protein
MRPLRLERSRPSAARWRRLLLLGGILVGFALRLIHLGAESLWYDETVSVYLARLPLAEMVERTAGDIHPPGYYALLHGWGTLVSPSLAHGLEFLYVLPSVFFGLLALPLLFAIGRRLFGERTGIAALWLLAFSPFAIWYSQEVRMYTLGAFLGLLCLWALLKWDARRKWRWLLVYVLAAAAGLYTLYYFLFLLGALFVLGCLYIFLHENHGPHSRLRSWGAWILAQFAILLLWLPWLGVFWRQATDPPVPPWRTAWDSPAAFLHSLAETLSALLVGQTPPWGIAWAWSVVTVLVIGGLLALAFSRAARCTTHWARRRLWLGVATVLIYVFVPIAILYAATLQGTPIYHVRYLSLYAPVFLLAPAWLVVNAWRLRTWLGALLWVALLGSFTLSLLAYWTNPLYRADDHRGAVASLSERWRPGDIILANAGWIHPILEVYWPSALSSPQDSAPPPPQAPVRLIDYTQNAGGITLDTPLVVRSGSVDGPPSLGWGDPKSDFFAISANETTEALAALAEDADRIWHYRLYDTVSDPTGVIRSWLATNTLTITETPIPGRDFGQVQLFAIPAQQSDIQAPADPPLATFGGAISLLEVSVPQTVAAGSYLYFDLLWQAQPALAELPADLSVSLRLYDANGQQVAQADGPPAEVPTRAWELEKRYPQAAALPVPGNLAPESYRVQIIVYRQDDAAALPDDATNIQERILGEVAVTSTN